MGGESGNMLSADKSMIRVFSNQRFPRSAESSVQGGLPERQCVGYASARWFRLGSSLCCNRLRIFLGETASNITGAVNHSLREIMTELSVIHAQFLGSVIGRGLWDLLAQSPLLRQALQSGRLCHCGNISKQLWQSQQPMVRIFTHLHGLLVLLSVSGRDCNKVKSSA